MSRIGKMVGLPALFGLLLWTTAGLGQETAGPPTDSEKLDLMQRHLNAIHKDIEGLSTNISLLANKTQADISKVQDDVAALGKELAQLRQDIEALRKQLPTQQISAYPPSGDPELDAIRKQLSQLHQDISAMRRQLDPIVHQAQAPPRTGTVRLVNRYPVDMDVLLNGQVYRLRPNETREFLQQAGAFSYRVLNVQGVLRNRMLAPDETFTITIE